MRIPLIRLWENLFRIPHKRENADKVSAASDELTSMSQALRVKLKPYLETDDPLVALMTDVFNQRGITTNLIPNNRPRRHQ